MNQQQGGSARLLPLVVLVIPLVILGVRFDALAQVMNSG